MPELLASTTSSELTEFMAYFTLLADESRPGGAPVQRVSGEAAMDMLGQAARKRRD